MCPYGCSHMSSSCWCVSARWAVSWLMCSSVNRADMTTLTMSPPSFLQAQSSLKGRLCPGVPAGVGSDWAHWSTTDVQMTLTGMERSVGRPDYSGQSYPTCPLLTWTSSRLNPGCVCVSTFIVFNTLQ